MGESIGRYRKAVAALSRPRASSVYILFSMWALCALFYYLGELIELAGWDALRWEFFYGVHDVHRVLFFVPIFYAAIIFGPRASLMITIISVMTFLPRAFLISPYPDPLARALIFALFAGVTGYSVAIVQRRSRRLSQLNAALSRQMDSLQAILDASRDGLVIVGPDYRIRYMNRSMIRGIGDGVGSCCYEFLKGRDVPCGSSCRLQAVLGGKTQTWECSLKNGKIYEIEASGYTDSDGVVCQLATLREVSAGRRTTGSVDPGS